MNQRMVSNRRSGGIAFWAWATSIAVHIAVLAVCGFVKFSQNKCQAKQRPVPTAKVNRIKKFIHSAPVIPKPKVKKSVNAQLTERTKRLPLANQIFDSSKPILHGLESFAKPPAAQDVLLPDKRIFQNRTEFFGSFTDQRKICYLVDCSGSMQGIFGRVRTKLKESIQSLQPDQYFSVVFFGNDRLFEFSDGRLLRAAEQTKQSAYDFIDLIRPAGQTNALAAIESVVQIRNDGGACPSVIYFLTDGFELTDENEWKFSQKVANLLNCFAPAVKINTIGFWPKSDDREMLKTIARQSGGEYVFITGDNN